MKRKNPIGEIYPKLYAGLMEKKIFPLVLGVIYTVYIFKVSLLNLRKMKTGAYF